MNTEETIPVVEEKPDNTGLNVQYVLSDTADILVPCLDRHRRTIHVPLSVLVAHVGSELAKQVKQTSRR